MHCILLRRLFKRQSMNTTCVSGMVQSPRDIAMDTLENNEVRKEERKGGRKEIGRKQTIFLPPGSSYSLIREPDFKHLK